MASFMDRRTPQIIVRVIPPREGRREDIAAVFDIRLRRSISRDPRRRERAESQERGAGGRARDGLEGGLKIDV